MRLSKRVKLTATFIFLLLLIIFYPFLDSSLTNYLSSDKEVMIERAVDGDTIDIGNSSVRLLGINTPERGEILYQEAKDFLQGKVANQTVRLEFVGERYDKYKRTLAYVFLGSENLNVEIVKNGYANYYFYSGKDKYSDEILDAWNICMKNKVNLCQPSDNKCSKCISINGEASSVINTCSLSCNIQNWSIKSEGREKFLFNGTLKSGSQVNFDLNLENSGGGLFLRDDKGKLVQWKE